MNFFGEFLGVVFGILFLLGALWWCWHGLVGTWYLIKLLVRKRLWLNTIVLVILMLIFGWNVLPILLAISIGLGPLTRSIAGHFYKTDLWK